jgi:Xaa-Pro dipeptidase
VCIAEANRRASLGHHRVAAAFRDGEHAELDLHLLYLGATSQDDPETPYKNIVALGRSAATLHHVDYRREAGPPSDTLLLDAGATFLGYASDITRTYVKPRSEAATTFAQLLAGMNKLQQQLCADVHAGSPYEALHEESHRLIGALLREVGLVRLSVEEMTEGSDVTRTFYPHGLGHSLGLQTHDVGCAQIKPKPRNPFLRNTSVITPGQVFTIEPGIYFIPGLLEQLRASPQAAAVDWQMVGALSELGGIRIEDDVLVREGGPVENLTRAVLA